MRVLVTVLGAGMMTAGYVAITEAYRDKNSLYPGAVIIMLAIVIVVVTLFTWNSVGLP